MATLALKFAAVLLILFAVMIGAIRAQPYEDENLRAFLQPTGCAMPCLMGMQPGVSLRADAAAALSARGWISSNTLITTEMGHQAMYWHGAGDADDLSLHFRRDRLEGIELHSSIPLGEIVLALGKPDRLTVIGVPVDQYYGSNFNVTLLIHAAIYERLGLVAVSFLSCPPSPAELWNTPSLIRYGDAFLQYEGRSYTFETYTLPSWFYVDVPRFDCVRLE